MKDLSVDDFDTMEYSRHDTYVKIRNTQQASNPFKITKLTFQVCEFCERNFADKSELKRHVESMHKKETFSCSECNYETNSQRNVNRNTERVHVKAQQSKEMFCTQCTYNTNIKRNLTRHTTAVHSSKSLKCYRCQEQFKTNISLDRHVIRNHPVNAELLVHEDVSTENMDNTF